MRGIRCILHVNIGKGKPAIPSSTLLAFATFFNFPPTHPEEGSRGARSEKTSHQDPSDLLLLPGHPDINMIYPTPVGIGVTVVCVSKCRLGRRRRAGNGGGRTAAVQVSRFYISFRVHMMKSKARGWCFTCTFHKQMRIVIYENAVR
jgi:hypothetical protein